MDTSLDFDATQVAPSTGAPEPVPLGTYLVEITKTEKKLNDNGWGLSVEFTIADGEYKGRKVFEQYNLQHTNPDTVRIAQEQFSALCHVTDTLKPRDIGEFLGKALQIRVKIDPPKNGYDARNRITQYLRIDGSKIGGNTVPFTAPAAAPKKAAATPVWAAAKKAS